MITQLFRLIVSSTGRGALLGAATAVMLGLAACGYHMEGEYLPENLSSISIGAVRNRTFTGELDVRVKHELRRKLMRNPHLRLLVRGQGELTLEIELTNASFTRFLDVSNTDLNSLRLRLDGRVLLFRTGDKRKVVRSQQISVSTVLGFDQPVIETPAVKDEITNDAIVLFVERVESVIYTSF